MLKERLRFATGFRVLWHKSRDNPTTAYAVCVASRTLMNSASTA
ncbi:hypothetical protein EPYR_03173 [Erwinia pyrifoliae DSM 12163]|nr:hypothetical protein EPYR_03173 [Erwinia pyrifoliae DSM 12163]